MSYDIITRINDKIISRVSFEGHVDKPETRTIEPVKHSDYNYYYFIIDRNPVKAAKTDIMTIEQLNIED